MRIVLVQKTIDFVRKNIIQNLKEFIYRVKINNNIRKLKKKEKIKVAFIHMYSGSVQVIPIFEAMLKDELFDPYFIVNPDVYRSKENFDLNYKETREELVAKYGRDRVLDGYSYDEDKYFDYTKMFDMAQKYFQIRYWTSKGIPVFHSNYAYTGRTKYEKKIFSLKEFKLMWKIFTENNFSKDYMASCGIKSKNISVVGYAKLDKLSRIQTKPRSRKRIIIAPHHTIFQIPNFLMIGSFLKYYDFILNLPKMYPDIDFIFRPHQLLIENLKSEQGWGPEKTEEYLKKLTDYENVEYQTIGNYLDTFVNSDALIHDCGSFLAEYFYTEHPQCYMFSSPDVIDREFTSFGKKMLNHAYKAFSEQEIKDFIDNVVLKENDYMKKDRMQFADKELKVNYPHSTESIIKIIKHEICGK